MRLTALLLILMVCGAIAYGAPDPVKAKYEGTIIGYSKKVDGQLRFDDAARRLVFYDRAGAEIVHIAYDDVTAVFADSESRRVKKGAMVGVLPIPFGAAWYVRRSKRYLIVQFTDPGTGAPAAGAFKIGDRNRLATTVEALAERARLTRRGDAYVRGGK